MKFFCFATSSLLLLPLLGEASEGGDHCAPITTPHGAADACPELATARGPLCLLGSAKASESGCAPDLSSLLDAKFLEAHRISEPEWVQLLGHFDARSILSDVVARPDMAGVDAVLLLKLRFALPSAVLTCDPMALLLSLDESVLEQHKDESFMDREYFIARSVLDYVAGDPDKLADLRVTNMKILSMVFLLTDHQQIVQALQDKLVWVDVMQYFPTLEIGLQSQWRAGGRACKLKKRRTVSIAPSS